MNPNDPARYVARTTADLATPGQWATIRVLAQAVGVDQDAVALARYGCRVTEMSQAAAVAYIRDLRDVPAGAAEPRKEPTR